MSLTNKSIKAEKKHLIFQIFTNKHVLGSILLTLFLIILFHIGSIITIPGINMGSDVQGNTFASMLNLLAGGGLSRLSLFSVGVGPYITSQIIVQLLSSDLIPPLSKIAKDGERGKKKIEVITRIITLPFCLAQSYAVIALILQNNGEGAITILGKTELSALSAGEIASLMIIFTAGSYIAIFLGDIITKRGVGNGITLLILSGIVASIISNFKVAFDTIQGKFSTSVTEQITMWLSVILYFSMFVLLMIAIVFIEQSIRKIPIQQTGQGLITKTEQLPYLPIKINSAGVIPVIFASSLMTIPETIGQFLDTSNEAGWFISRYLLIATPVGLTLYVVFILLFTFFYSYIQLNPEQMAENFEKSGKFIPGVAQGYDTQKHITKVLNRINCIGAPFLAIISALPYLISYVSDIPSGIALGGTGIIIVVSATLELWYSIYSNTKTSGYNVHRSNIEKNIKTKKFIEEEETSHQLW